MSSSRYETKREEANPAPWQRSVGGTTTPLQPGYFSSVPSEQVGLTSQHANMLTC